MSQSDSSESDPPESAPVSSGEVETPRGGFMARPGLKAPPRHAVVVRVGDAPDSGQIPLARSSFPPPPPPSMPPPESLSEKITLRAIPTPRPPANVESMEPVPATPAARSSSTAAGESAPPPSDAPVVASVFEERVTLTPRSRRAARSRLTIVAAAAAGLVLGIISVVTTVRMREATETTAMAASFEPSSPVTEASASPVFAPSVAASAAPVKAPAPQREPGSTGAQTDDKPSPAAAKPAAAKRSIF